MKTKVYVVGNSLVKTDSLPLKLLPKLKKTFPQFEFIEADPNENFIPENDAIIIDTVQGIKDVQLFDSLDEFAQTRSVSPHDYDLGFHLKFLLKLGRTKRVKILGVPFDAAFAKVVEELRRHVMGAIST